MKNIVNPVEYVQPAVEEYKALYGGSLVSVILYGSAAGGDFDPVASDINLLMVLSAMDLELIAKSATIQERYVRQRISRPLFIDKEYIDRSSDSYPMEFLDMQGCYKVLYGEDVLGPVTPKEEHLRLQVERELKGKWLHLLQGFSSVRKSKKQLAQLVRVSLKAFSPVFRALLKLKGAPVPFNRKELFSVIESAYSLQGQPFGNIAHACISKGFPEIESRFIAYARAVKQIIDSIENN